MLCRRANLSLAACLERTLHGNAERAVGIWDINAVLKVSEKLLGQQMLDGRSCAAVKSVVLRGKRRQGDSAALGWFGFAGATGMEVRQIS